ncbi:MAG: hypothetical protein ACYC54_05900 [Sedimentisphaerales bacterium]
MKSMGNYKNYPAGRPLVADDILEFHAARLLLLLRCCGTHNRSKGSYQIDGLTKMAKLDFFVRYPEFFAKIVDKPQKPVPYAVESTMVRFHYGPWDQRYYHILAYLEGRGLININRKDKSFLLELTMSGKKIAESLCSNKDFETICIHMKDVKNLLGSKSGSSIKNLIYKTFHNEVSNRELGEVITS